MNLYSRSVYIHYPGELKPGDLVDVAITEMSSRATVEHVGDCADDDADEPDCVGECRGVVFLVDTDLVAQYHVGADDDLYARLLATDTQDDVDAETVAHVATAAADYATRVAEAAR